MFKSRPFFHSSPKIYLRYLTGLSGSFQSAFRLFLSGRMLSRSDIAHTFCQRIFLRAKILFRLSVQAVVKILGKTYGLKIIRT